MLVRICSNRGSRKPPCGVGKVQRQINGPHPRTISFTYFMLHLLQGIHKIRLLLLHIRRSVHIHMHVFQVALRSIQWARCSAPSQVCNAATASRTHTHPPNTTNSYASPKSNLIVITFHGMGLIVWLAALSWYARCTCKHTEVPECEMCAQ